MEIQDIFCITSVAVTCLLRPIIKKYPNMKSSMEYLTNLLIGVIVAFTEWLITRDFSFAIAISGLMTGGAYDLFQNLRLFFIHLKKEQKRKGADYMDNQNKENYIENESNLNNETLIEQENIYENDKYINLENSKNMENEDFKITGCNEMSNNVNEDPTVNENAMQNENNEVMPRYYVFPSRTQAPSKNNPRFYSNQNPYYAAGYGMPNCTAYVYGRYWEVTGEKVSKENKINLTLKCRQYLIDKYSYLQSVMIFLNKNIQDENKTIFLDLVDNIIQNLTSIRPISEFNNNIVL